MPATLAPALTPQTWRLTNLTVAVLDHYQVLGQPIPESLDILLHTTVPGALDLNEDDFSAEMIGHICEVLDDETQLAQPSIQAALREEPVCPK